MANVNDVAAAVVDDLGKCTTLKLQKLLYYCQGWHLAWDGEPLFRAHIEAWANGPVVPAIYRLHRNKFSVQARWPEDGNPDNLTESQRESIDVVLDTYRDLNGEQLAFMTHRERPWLEARGELPIGEASKRRVSTDVMQDFFGAKYAALD